MQEHKIVAPILEFLLKSVVLILIALTGFAYTTLLERRFIARLQARIGPNRRSQVPTSW